MVGGVSELKMECIFSETGGIALEIISYKAEIEWNEKNKPFNRTFDKVLAERIPVEANSTFKKDLDIERDIGDILLKAKHDRFGGKVKIFWNAIDSEGNNITSVSEGSLPR